MRQARQRRKCTCPVWGCVFFFYEVYQWLKQHLSYIGMMQHVLNLDKSLSCLLFQTSFLLCKMVLYCAPRTIQNPQLIEPPANCCSFFFFLSLCFHWVLSNEIIQESDLGESTLKICNMLYLCDFKKKKISQERIFGQQNSNEFLSSNKVLNLSRKIGVKAAGDGRGYVCRTVQGPGISFS